MEVAHEAGLEIQLVAFVAQSSIVMRAQEAARSLNLRSWCIGAGAIRNLVWDNLHGFKTETMPEDIDLVFHDASDLSSERERLLEKALAQAEPAFRWEAVNQASVHHWLKSQGALEVQPYQTLVEGIASCPEVAICVGVTLSLAGIQGAYPKRFIWNGLPRSALPSGGRGLRSWHADNAQGPAARNAGVPAARRLKGMQG